MILATLPPFEKNRQFEYCTFDVCLVVNSMPFLKNQSIFTLSNAFIDNLINASKEFISQAQKREIVVRA
jgi:hypothetical protein